MEKDNKKTASIEKHLSIHKFERNIFIKDIIMFHEAELLVEEEGLKIFKKIDNKRVTTETLRDLEDKYLIKIHKYFWDRL